MKKLVAYQRVSTARQGKSGLGLEAQVASVESYARQNDAEIVATYTEVESGKNADRPKLQEAIGHANLVGATLIVAKLDRLSRSVSFLAALMESGVKFIACDNPHANELTIHILVAVAQAEAKAISERTKVALSAYKARGGKLGATRTRSQNLTDEARRKGAAASAEANSKAANEKYQFLYPKILAWRADDLSYRAIADRLNQQGLPTRSGSQWTAMAVLRVYRRAVGQFGSPGPGRPLPSAVELTSSPG